MSQHNQMVRSATHRVQLIAQSMMLMGCLYLSSLYADENKGVNSQQTDDAKEWIEQLGATSYAQRHQAFLKLCDPTLDIASEINQVLADEPNTVSDPELSAMIVWVKRIRALPGTIDSRMDAIRDFPALSQGSIEVVERYVSEGKLELLLEMVRLIPKSSRDLILQNIFIRGEGGLNRLFEKAWQLRRPDLIPKFLDAMLPSHPVRIGLNRRWAMLGFGDSWQIDVSLETTEMQIAALESQGQIKQALNLARQTTRPEMVEKILLRNQGWDDWLNLDPSKLTMISAVWSELPRVLVLEALDRHEEAKQYYALRSSLNAKGRDSQLLLAQLAMVTGDMDRLVSDLKEHAPNELANLYFLQNRIEDLLEHEGLSERTEATVSTWLEKNIVEGKGFSRAARFQALFRRLGEIQWSDAILSRVVEFIDTHSQSQQIQLWKDYLQQAMRYGLDELRTELLTKAVARLDSGRLLDKRAAGAIAGFPEAQVEKELTLEDLFRESFPFLKDAGYPLYVAMSSNYLDASQRQRIQWIDSFHQGVMPQEWSPAEVLRLFQSAVSFRMLEGAPPKACVIDLAESLDVMGLRDQALELLDSIRGVTRADVMRSQILWRIGKYHQSRELVLEILQRSDGGLEAYQWACELFQLLRDRSSYEHLDRKTLTCSSGMEDFAAYSREIRRGVRFELAEPIGRFLEFQYDSFPSSLSNLWLEDVFWGWNLSLLANHYHQTAPEFPERVPRNFDLSLTSCLFDQFEEFDSLNGNFRTMQDRGPIGWDLDWSQWAWRYERVFSAAFWKAVREGDRAQADRFLRAAHRLNPEQINTLIDAAPWVLEKFGKETLQEWFLVYYQPMQEHLKKFPMDTLVANNSAWLAVKCGFELDRALELSQMVTKRYPTDTYLDTLAEVHFARGEIDEAIGISLNCQKLNPRDPHHRRQLKRYSDRKQTTDL